MRPLAAAIALAGLLLVAATASAREVRLRPATALKAATARSTKGPIPASALEAVVTGPVHPG